MEMQQERVELYCKLHNLTLTKVIQERAVSAKSPLAERPGGSQLLQSPAKHIIALKLDRLFRNAADALRHVEAWDRSQTSLHLVDMGGQSINTGSSMGKMMITMLAGFAEFERNMIAERTTAALRHKREHGRVYNHLPYGFSSHEGCLRPIDSEQEVIRTIRTLRTAGTSYNEIANHLNAAAVPTKRNKVWRSQAIKNVLDLNPPVLS